MLQEILDLKEFSKCNPQEGTEHLERIFDKYVNCVSVRTGILIWVEKHLQSSDLTWDSLFFDNLIEQDKVQCQERVANTEELGNWLADQCQYRSWLRTRSAYRMTKLHVENRLSPVLGKAGDTEAVDLSTFFR